MAELVKSSRIGKLACRLLLPAALLYCSLAALAQDAAAFPNRPIKIITPTAAGGNIGILARTLAEKPALAWGHGVVLEPRPRSRCRLPRSTCGWRSSARSRMAPTF